VQRYYIYNQILMNFKTLNIYTAYCLLIHCLLNIGCYSFRGVTIAPETKTYSIALFTNNAPAAPPTLAQTFTERLKDKIRNNTRLQLVNTEGADLAFSGQVSGFDVVAVSPQPGQASAFNQLRITFNVDLTDNKNEKGSWKQSFSFQADFPGTTQLLTVQDQLIKTITDKILEDIFNKAFTENW
jgi:Lipopolysaccharide-assembly